ncbi:MAG: hypothetical protein NVSMB6_00450 [Burkholderiaceae bacterium]
MFAIRAAQADDLRLVHQILHGSALPFDDITDHHLMHFLILGGGKQVAGCVGIESLGAEALLRSLAVRDVLRGRGWGERLVQAAEMHARNVGVSSLYLLTTTAASFFERIGYQQIDRADAPKSLHTTTQFSTLCPSSSTCLFKSLPLTI